MKENNSILYRKITLHSSWKYNKLSQSYHNRLVYIQGRGGLCTCVCGGYPPDFVTNTKSHLLFSGWLTNHRCKWLEVFRNLKKVGIVLWLAACWECTLHWLRSSQQPWVGLVKKWRVKMEKGVMGIDKQTAYKGRGSNYWVTESDSYKEFQKYQWRIVCSGNQF